VKAANLLYLIVKNQSFSDGNKRIATALFVYFLEMNHALRTASEGALTRAGMSTAIMVKRRS
jgi:prophage maintenance system killer protein